MPTPADPRALPALYRLASLANRTADAHEALREVLASWWRHFEADAGSIALLNPNSGRLEVDVQHGLPENTDQGGLKLGHGVTGWCVLHARSLLVPDVAIEARYIAVRPTARCEMAVPMSEDDQVIGVIDLESDRRGGFSSQDLALLERLTVEATVSSCTSGAPVISRRRRANWRHCSPPGSRWSRNSRRRNCSIR